MHTWLSVSGNARAGKALITKLETIGAIWTTAVYDRKRSWEKALENGYDGDTHFQLLSSPSRRLQEDYHCPHHVIGTMRWAKTASFTCDAVSLMRGNTCDVQCLPGAERQVGSSVAMATLIRSFTKKLPFRLLISYVAGFIFKIRLCYLFSFIKRISYKWIEQVNQPFYYERMNSVHKKAFLTFFLKNWVILLNANVCISCKCRNMQCCMFFFQSFLYIQVLSIARFPK